jgi:general secretion pathway protein A
MYNEYFGFAESPFNVTTDPRFFYSNRLYQEAFTGLRWGVKLRQGLIVLTGEAGTGKTTLLKRVATGFEPSIHTALISSHHRSFAQMLRRILINFGLSNPPNNRLMMLEKFRSYLTEAFKENRIIGVLLDEAQDMDVRTIKELGLLLDLDIDSQKLLQIVLLGSPELEAKLQLPELRSINQRVALWCRLAPLKSDEVAPYIDLRVTRAGYEGESLFAPDAVQQIARFSKGIPRLINTICDNALLAAYSAGQKSVSCEMIEKISYDLRLSEEFEPKAAVFSSRVEKGAESGHLSEPNEEDFKASNPVTDNHTSLGDEGNWSFEKFPVDAQNNRGEVRRAENNRAFKIAGVLAILILVASTATLYFERSRGVFFTNSDNLVVLPEISIQVNEEPIPEVLEEKIFGEPSSVQVPMPQEPVVEQESKSSPQKTVQVREKASLAALKTADINAKVFLHTSKEGDRSILEEIGDALRIKGYTIPDTRLSSSRTQGDVRFFFSQDRADAESVKSIVEAELGRLGYRISLDVLERDGKKFQFAAPGKIEVWMPPLPKS